MTWLYSFKKKLIIIIVGFLTVSIVLTMIFISRQLRERLIEDNLKKSEVLSEVVHTSLKSLMLAREPTLIQLTIEEIGHTNATINKTVLLDHTGTVKYSSDKAEIGRKLDKFTETSCKHCHIGPDSPPPGIRHLNLDVNGKEVQRLVTPIYNEKPCHQCHPSDRRINGKLVIDRLMSPVYSLISTIQFTIFAGGLICLVILLPVLSKTISRGLDKYIREIIRHGEELELLYAMLERLSKTLDIRELKQIAFDIVGAILEADEVNIIMPTVESDFRVSSWSSADDGIHRRKVEPGDALYPVIQDWLAGRMESEVISDDYTSAYIPIVKAGTPLSLITATSARGAFKDINPGLITAMRRHIAIAFENAMLYQMAITDELTRLYTKRYFRTMIDKEFDKYESYGEKIGLLVIDIDDFKNINDTHGHVAGDSVLHALGTILLDAVRDDDIAFRYGGEEFTVILPSTGRNGAMHVGERIRRAVEEHVFEPGTLDLKITVSVGASICPDDAENVKDLVLRADKAMYKAKQSGKNKVVSAGETEG